MNASKENARKAEAMFLSIIESSPSLLTPFRREIQHITEFLRAAERKLPSEDSYQKEKNRRYAREYGATKGHMESENPSLSNIPRDGEEEDE